MTKHSSLVVRTRGKKGKALFLEPAIAWPAQCAAPRRSAAAPPPRRSSEAALKGRATQGFDHARSRASRLTRSGLPRPGPAAAAQTATYHLHVETWGGSGTDRRLITAGPDAAATWLVGNLPGPSRPRRDVLGLLRDGAKPSRRAGVIPAGSVFSFSFWMRKTAEVGTLYTKGRLDRRQPVVGDATLCTATPSSALTTTFAQYHGQLAQPQRRSR